MTAPIATKKPHSLEKHGDSRVDHYYWLRERENPEVLAYLNEENAHTEAVLQPIADLRKTVFEEMKSRIKEDDSSTPAKEGDYFYYRRMESGKEYPIYCRKKGVLDGVEEILLDSNTLAQGTEYFNLSSFTITRDHKLAAYALDTVGRNIFTIYFKNLETGQLLPHTVEQVTGNLAWANDHKTLFYSKQDLETLRSYQVYRCNLGENSELLFEEKDETFRTYVHNSSSHRFILISSTSTLTSEFQYLDANEPAGKFKLFLARERGHEYALDDGGDRFLIHTNDQAKNFKLMEADFNHHAKSDWREVVAHRADTLLEGVQPFKTHIALQERHNGLTQIQILDRKNLQAIKLQFPDSVYIAQIGGSREFDTPWVRYSYESLATPASVYDYNMSTGEQVLKKQQEVPGFSPGLYETKRLFAPASDGTKIPISLVKRTDVSPSAKTPCMIYGYGSYGHSMDPNFASGWISLLDRGFVVAIAHVRGGSEMGRHWYEDGRQLKKKNSFTDFIACSEYLIREGWTSAAHLYATGGSAGGLLMGAVMNLRPDLYNGVVAAVPFVDVITTMLDDSIPLTTGEYDEWGNPNDKQFYDYMLSYSPYDNLKPQAYPNLLITTGLHDSQVQYWEPAKWAAKLRTVQQGPNQILLWTEMDAGHGGKTGRFDRLHEAARRYAFFIGLEK